MEPNQTSEISSLSPPPIRAFTISDFLRCYGISRTRTYAEIGAGRLIARRLGGRTVITRDDAEAWLTSLPAHRPNSLSHHGRAA